MRKRLLALVLALGMSMCLSVPAQAIGTTAKAGEVQTASCGQNHTAVIKSDGTLWTWGGNNMGQLGNGTLQDQVTPVEIMSDVAHVACGNLFTAAVKTDGTLWMWGSDILGQLGTGAGSADWTFGDVRTDDTKSTPVQIMSNVSTVSCGQSFTMAIKTDGTLWGWGQTNDYQLGNNGAHDKRFSFSQFQSVPVKLMDNVTAVSCGGEHAAAIKTDGSLWIWGNNEDGQLGTGGREAAPTPIKVMEDVQTVSCGTAHTAAIKTDGSLWVWGYSCYTGNDSTESKWQDVPTKVMDDVVAVSCGDYYTMAIKNDGTLWAWGDNTFGQLGVGTGGDQVWLGQTLYTPMLVMEDVCAVSCGNGRFTAAVLFDGTLWMWGNNQNGQLEQSPGENRNIPALVADNVALPKAFPELKPASTVGGFSDVREDQYYADAVLWAVENGITSGTTASTFSPNNTCTTAQILTFLWRANGSPAISGGNPFTDVSASAYYYQAARWAREKGLISGSAFNGDTPCTRAATVTYLWKLAGQPSAGASGFTDVPSSASYAQAVAWAVREGITSGTSASTFSPDNTCTRAQIVTFLYRDMA